MKFPLTGGFRGIRLVPAPLSGATPDSQLSTARRPAGVPVSFFFDFALRHSRCNYVVRGRGSLRNRHLTAQSSCRAMEFMTAKTQSHLLSTKKLSGIRILMEAECRTAERTETDLES